MPRVPQTDCRISKVGTFPQSLMDEAKGKGWTVVDMKNDWRTIFPPAKANP